MKKERHVRIFKHLIQKLKRITTLLAAVSVLLFLVAADMDNTTMSLTGAAAGLMTDVMTGDSILWLLITGWFATIGAMCMNLKKIPGVKQGRSDSKSHSH